MAGHSGQFTPGGYLSTVKHTTLAGIEPTTFQLLVRRATSCATETIIDVIIIIPVLSQLAWSVSDKRHHSQQTTIFKMTRRSECPDVKNCKWRFNPAWHRMLHSYSCMATVGVNGLSRKKSQPGSTEAWANLPSTPNIGGQPAIHAVRCQSSCTAAEVDHEAWARQPVRVYDASII